MTALSQIVHGTAVALGPRGILIRGAAGSGKSSLAFALIGMGARLVSDDRVVLTVHDETVRMSAPDTIAGLIEARGVGILRLPDAQICAQAALSIVVDLDRGTTSRLPEGEHDRLLGQDVPVILGAGHGGLAPILFALLMGAERIEPEAG